MKIELTKTQASMIQELFVANAIRAQQTAEVVDLIIKCQAVRDEPDDGGKDA